MKTKFLLISIVTLLTINLFSQWQTDVRLTNNSAGSHTSNNNTWCIATNGNIVHIVWSDVRENNYEIYYKRSTDAGLTWDADIRLTNNSGDSWYPAIAISGSNVYVGWYDNRDGNDEIYFKRSTDVGVSWTTDTRLTNNTAYSYYPSVAVYGSYVYVVWQDLRDGNWEIYFKLSSDGGITWGAETSLTNNFADSLFPSIAVSGSFVYVVWHDERDGNMEIYFKRSTDGGLDWETETRISNYPVQSGVPSIAVSGSFVHVVWLDERDFNWEVYYKYSTDCGINWSTDTRLTNNPDASYNPSITVSNGFVHVAWQDYRDGNLEIYYKSSTDAGINWGTDTRLTNNTSTSNLPSIAVSGSLVNVLWSDDRNGNFEIYYKRNPTGNIGLQITSTEIPHKFSLSQNYPNPFNPTTNFEFSIPQAEFVNLTIYDAMGRVVETLHNGELKSGIYKADWNASNFPSGVYFYRLSAGSFNDTKKMILIR